MNLYEHTIIARQDTSPSEIKQLTEKYSKIVEKNDGKIVKTENWGLINLSHIIKKNKKGSYIHFKIEGNGQMIDELEKNESIDKKLLRYLTIKVKKFLAKPLFTSIMSPMEPILFKFSSNITFIYIKARFLALFIDKDNSLCFFWRTLVILVGKIFPFSEIYFFTSLIFS